MGLSDIKWDDLKVFVPIVAPIAVVAIWLLTRHNFKVKVWVRENDAVTPDGRAVGGPLLVIKVTNRGRADAYLHSIWCRIGNSAPFKLRLMQTIPNSGHLLKARGESVELTSWDAAHLMGSEKVRIWARDGHESDKEASRSDIKIARQEAILLTAKQRDDEAHRLAELNRLRAAMGVAPVQPQPPRQPPQGGLSPARRENILRQIQDSLRDRRGR